MLLLAGCTVGPKYSAPEIELPCEWQSEISEDMSIDPLETFNWWESFHDLQLNSLIERAATQNLDLHIAATRICQARLEKKAKKADLYPHIDASANYDHVYYSKDALVNGLLGLAGPVHSNRVKRNVDFFELGFDAEWEIDLFGMRAHEQSALKAKEESLRENLCWIWVTLSAEVAKNYIELRGLQSRLEILEKNIAAQDRIIALTELLYKKGQIDAVAVNQAQGELSLMLGEKPLMELATVKAIYRLSILLGYAPGDLMTELSCPKKVPLLSCDKPIGIPSELLRRRPDIRRAERELAASTERIGSAIAALFPRFSLRGFVGDISTHLGSIFNPASTTWAAGPQLLLPIFNSKLLVEDVNYNKIATQQALYEYQKTVLEALEETEQAIASYRFEQERYQHLSDSYRIDQKTVELTEQLYGRGVKNGFDILAAQKIALKAEDLCLQSQINLLINYISLYKSLGGGFSNEG